MSPQAFALRPLRWTDLPALKRWRGLPEIQRHLRHPTPPTWVQHVRWFLRVRRDPTCQVWAVTYGGKLVGQAGWYYRRYNAAEVSILVVFGTMESFTHEATVLHSLLAPKAREYGLTTLWAEVLSRAPVGRHTVFPAFPTSTVTADGKSTIYRWSIA